MLSLSSLGVEKISIRALRRVILEKSSAGDVDAASKVNFLRTVLITADKCNIGVRSLAWYASRTF